jgi:hypothetical protein
VADEQLRFLERCAALDGAALGEGAFADGPAVWVGTREVAHFHEAELEVRLTKRVIRERRAEFTADERITLRRNVSDWLTVRVASAADRECASSLVEAAVEANRASAPPGLPPTGAHLARRRRFH